MSVSPLHVQIVVNTGAFEEAMRKAIAAINASAAQIEAFGEVLRRHRRRTEVHRTRVQYRRKSRGHR